MSKNQETETITLAGGCFWCTEAIFERLKGVISVVSGYSGGDDKNPNYEAVASGRSGHAESIQFTFNPKIISLKDLLEVFFALHDPTTLNKQGADVGSQYRSAIFYHAESQKKVIEDYIKKLNSSGKYKDKIVTDVVKFKGFYEAEEYHKEYYNNNRLAPYCQIVIDPKIQKLYKDFGKYTKKDKI